MKRSSAILKRSFDIGFSGVILIATSPLLLLMAAGIKLSSKGPVIYNQERLGKTRIPFIMYKFRTMNQNAEEHGPRLTYPGDPRITKFGKLLRRYHLDEIAQFWNVLKGDMSLVGPRPERRIYVEEIEKKYPEYNKIFEVKPGITSLGMVRSGYAWDIDKMIERSRHDLDYIRNQSLKTDTKIILKTIRTVLKGKGI